MQRPSLRAPHRRGARDPPLRSMSRLPSQPRTGRRRVARSRARPTSTWLAQPSAGPATSKMWEMIDHKTAQAFDGKQFLSVKNFQEYDCKRSRRRMLAATAYAGHIGKGAVVGSSSLRPFPVGSCRHGRLFRALLKVGLRKEVGNRVFSPSAVSSKTTAHPDSASSEFNEVPS